MRHVARSEAEAPARDPAAVTASKPGSNFKAKEGTKGTSRLVGVAVRVSEICALKEKYVLICYWKIISKLNSSSNFKLLGSSIIRDSKCSSFLNIHIFMLRDLKII